MARPSVVSVVPLARSFWKWKSSTPPNAPFEVWCRFWSWAVLPLEMKPPAEKSIQLLKELVPPSNICSGVSGAGALAWGGGGGRLGRGGVRLESRSGRLGGIGVRRPKAEGRQGETEQSCPAPAAAFIEH